MTYTPFIIALKAILLYLAIRLLNTLYLKCAGFTYRFRLSDSVIIGAVCLAAALWWEWSARQDREQADTGDWDRLTGDDKGTPS